MTLVSTVLFVGLLYTWICLLHGNQGLEDNSSLFLKECPIGNKEDCEWMLPSTGHRQGPWRRQPRKASKAEHSL